MSLSPAQKWAAQLANQIKAIQISWADDEEKVRREMVEQELERSILQLSSTEREDYLAALSAHFPVPGEARVERIVERVVEEAPPRALTPEETLERLLEAAPRLTESQRRSFSERLSVAGFRIQERRPEPTAVSSPPVMSESGMDRVPDALARKLGIRGEPKVYPVQVFNVLLELVDSFLALSGAASQILTEMRRRAGEPPASRDEDLRLTLAQYLGDQASASPDRMRNVIDKTRRRLAGFLKISADLPGDLCGKAATISPEKVIEVVTKERRPGIMDNKYQMYWERYNLLWNQHKWGMVQDSPVWEKRVAQSVVNTVERGD